MKIQEKDIEQLISMTEKGDEFDRGAAISALKLALESDNLDQKTRKKVQDRVYKAREDESLAVQVIARNPLPHSKFARNQ